MIHRISLATDFSPEGVPAFHAALALAVAWKARLDILHVGGRDEQPTWENFPHVRATLEAWDRLPRGSRQQDVWEVLGVNITKVAIHGHDPATGVAEFVTKHRPDLLVAASHGQSGGSWWHRGSVAMEAMRLADLPSLLFGPSARDMTDPNTGALTLRNVLMPVADTPPPRAALGKLHILLDPQEITLHAIHAASSTRSDTVVRSQFPEAVSVEGEVVPAILSEAERVHADVIAMPTARKKGLFGALRGSTTEKVLRSAPCAVLALPS